MKASNESPQQARKTESPVVAPAPKLIFKYPQQTTDDDIKRSVQYYADETNKYLATTRNQLRVTLGNITPGQKENSKEVTVTGSYVGLIGDMFMKGGTPNPPPNPPQPIMPPDSVIYNNTQLIHTLQGNYVIDQRVAGDFKLNKEVDYKVITKQG